LLVYRQLETATREKNEKRVKNVLRMVYVGFYVREEISHFRQKKSRQLGKKTTDLENVVLVPAV